MATPFQLRVRVQRLIGLVLIGRTLNQKDPGSTKIYARLDMDPVRQSMMRATTAMFQAAGLKATAEAIDLQEPQPPKYR